MGSTTLPTHMDSLLHALMQETLWRSEEFIDDRRLPQRVIAERVAIDANPSHC